MRFLSICIAGVALALTGSATPADVPSGYQLVAQAEHVPAAILYAVACAESGRRMPDGRIRPWPWTLDIAGDGHWYPTRRGAYRTLMRVLPQESSVDIGLGQINWYWHHDRLITPWLALDPYFNLHATARLLRDQFERCRCDDWWVAAERYHAPSDDQSAGEERSRYRRKVKRCWQEE